MKLIQMSLLSLMIVSTLARPSAGREVTSFDRDWRFHLGEVVDGEKPETPDADWRTLDVPHDWMIEQSFDQHSPGGVDGGALDGGIGWYRKTFTLPSAASGQRVFIDFDGVYMDSDVWLNGKHIGNQPYGYTSFEYDLTSAIKFDGPNVLAVRAEVIQPCSRFYSGAGIYRHVRLVTTDPVHVAQWGTTVVPKLDNDDALIDVTTTVDNDADEPATVNAVAGIVDDASGKDEGSSERDDVQIPAHAHAFPLTFTPIKVVHASRWSVDTPTLHRTKIDIVRGGKAIDSTTTAFGIRSIEFTKDNGMLLNGQRLQLHGVCDHHDLGCLGAAVNTRAIQRQLEILKTFGVNAIRTSHNPPAPELLDLCDRMGFVVMDEAFDEWAAGKRPFGYSRFFSEWSERDLNSLIERDRNHPSVVMWSIGNEIPEIVTREGPAICKRLTSICHRDDPTRPVTSALDRPDDAASDGFADALDVFGINYHPQFYNNSMVKEKRPVIGSETSSVVSSRGEYGLSLRDGQVATTQRANFQMSSYDTWAPSWATTADVDLRAVRDATWVAGEFVWTGFDYLGEPTPFGWPSRSSYFGIVDLCGFPKDRYYLYQSQWTSKPMVHLLPHWNWPGFEGKAIDVWAYTNAQTVELFLNGRSLGERKMDAAKQLHVSWSVPYEAGELKAIAKNDGNVVANDAVRTADAPATMQLAADRSTINADGNDLSYVTVRVVDQHGTLCPDAGDEVAYSLSGPGLIAGLDDGDATNHERFQGNRHRVFHGMGLVVIRAGKSAGKLQLTATQAGLPPASIDINVK